MNKDNEDILEFLRQQLEWYKEQDAILEEMEKKLYEMKEIAEYRLKYDIEPAEIEYLNSKLQDLKRDVQLLEKRLYAGVVH